MTVAMVGLLAGFIFHLIAHTHWDREWYLPQAAFHARLVPALDDLIDELRADPAYRSFLLDGQTVLLEDYLRARPDREGELRALVKTGRLQLGPWYVLADEQIPSGEALVRNLLIGAADADRWGGRSDVLYSPDAFGHPAVWPTLAREFGIKYGVVWRGLGGEAEQTRDLYRWRGPDGREVLVWHLPPAGYSIGAGLRSAADVLRTEWPDVRDVLLARAAARHVPVFIGADHHAPPAQLGRLRDLLAELDPGNAFRVSRLDEFFQAVDSTPAAPLSGELRWSYRYTWTLQGVHGTRAPLKRRNSQLELLMERSAEPLAALARRAGGRDRRPLLDLAWRSLIRCQFHDVIAGCVSDPVAESIAARHLEVESIAAEVVRGSLHDLVKHDPDAARERRDDWRPSLVLWNPAARPREGVLIADVTFFRRDVLVGPPTGRTPREGPGADGTAIPLQILDQGPARERLDASRHYPDLDDVTRVRVAIHAPPVPGLGVTVVSLADDRSIEPREAVSIRGRTIANALVEVTIEGNGSLALHDVRTGERFSGLLGLESEGDAGDTYTYHPARGSRSGRAGPATVRRVAAGPLVAALETRYDLVAGAGARGGRSGRVAVRCVVTLHAGSPIVRCIFHVDNDAVNHRLRARLPTGLDDVAATAGSAFGSVERTPVIVDTSMGGFLETPVRTAPAHRFVAAARERRGLALLAPGFFEYEWTPAGDFLFTVLRAVGQLSRDDLPSRPGHAAWPCATPLAQCLGQSRVDLALAPVGRPDVESGDALPHLWEDAFLPVRGFWLRDAVALEPAATGVELEGAGLVLSAVKPAQAGSPLVLRCYNATGHKTAGVWRFPESVHSAHRVRADERESAPIVLEGRGSAVRFFAEPYEVVTMLIT